MHVIPMLPRKLHLQLRLIIMILFLAVNLCSNPDDRLQIYRECFEAAYLETTESFYKAQAPEYLAENGVQNYMRYVSGIIDSKRMTDKFKKD